MTLPAGGNYEFVQYNFTGSTDTQRVYGVNGSGLAFEFDGTYLVPIRTGMTTDTPSHIAAHRNYLFLSFRGSLQMSGIGDPYAWSPVLGRRKSQWATRSALLPFPGDATTKPCRYSAASTRTLYGSSSADFKLATASPTTGAKSGTAQWLGAAYCLSDRGVQQVSQSQAFGDFQFNAVSGLIQPLINDIRNGDNELRAEGKEPVPAVLLGWGCAVHGHWSREIRPDFNRVHEAGLRHPGSLRGDGNEFVRARGLLFRLG